MHDEQVIIASAVIVPSVEASPPERMSKRRQSTGSPETSKRTRLHEEESGIINDEAINRGGAETRAVASGEHSRPSRRRSGAEEERNRGKRLFGALLGTIGKFQQDSSSARARNSAVKRREVEAKLQEKLKLQTEEIDERKKKEDDDINLRRRLEQREFNERAMNLRHTNLLAQANILYTAASPKLFYLPWKLLPAEEERIRAQIEEAEATVKREREEFEQLKEHDEDLPRDLTSANHPHNDLDAVNEDVSMIAIGEDIDDGNDTVNPTIGENTNLDHHLHHTTHEYDERVASDLRRQSDAGDNGDLIVEAGEDTVIY
ncbi:hypothetical protein RUND412_008306 [Rhizina undulata]